MSLILRKYIKVNSNFYRYSQNKYQMISMQVILTETEGFITI